MWFLIIRSRTACVASALALAVILQTTEGIANEAPESDEAKPYVVKIHADWCGTCKMLEPTWTRIRSELGDEAHVVNLDVSDRAALQRSQAEAERLGISEFFREYRGSTGTIAVLDGKNHRPIAILRGETDFSKYQEAVAEAGRSS
jgi:thiol-disulfide isomerase/thioredoxin